MDLPVSSGKLGGMFLRAKRRFKDGKEHRYWSIVENHRTLDNKVVQRQVLYLGEINDGQQASWVKTIEVIQQNNGRGRQMALFPADRALPELACEAVQIQLNALELHRPRQWGACWLACQLWNLLDLDRFWITRLPPNRKKTRWLNILKTLVCYRLISPGSEWRLHREWYQRSAMGDLLGEDIEVISKDKLYRCLDQLLKHKKDLFSYLTQRWKNLFQARFDILLYDLTSTYFESDPPGVGKRRFGYSRDKRSDCVQIVLALIVTPEGFPLAYEVLAGNTSDKTTLTDFLESIEEQYGRADRTWVMDRGIPTEETLQAMRDSSRPIHYLVGTPKGRLTQLEQAFLTKPWQQVRDEVQVRLLQQDGELYVLARSDGRVHKERAMRQRRLKKLWHRLKELQTQKITRDTLLLKIGAAKKEAGRVYALVDISLPRPGEAVNPETFTFRLRKEKLRKIRKREGCYLLRSNLTQQDPAQLWKYYTQLTEVEQAFKELKGDLAIRPIYHQSDARIEAHIFVAFLAYCLQVTLKFQASQKAPGLTPRAILEKFAAQQMVDVYLPTTDGRRFILSRFTQPDQDQKLLLHQLKLTLPKQPLPRLAANRVYAT
ncbi:IS1634 family transposase [Candidatus Bathyarchaeota archaeon]|nr:IS1634 family transposase [Candidatus Bathyarchaeota archaeon]